MQRTLKKYWIPILIFIISIPISYRTITNPLQLKRDWLTAHTLVSLHYYSRCSLISGWGASILLPPDGEFDCRSASKSDTYPKAIYLSYPSLWLNTIQPIYELSNSLLPQSIPDYAIIRILTLIFVRLPLLISGYFLFFFLYRSISKDRIYWRAQAVAAAASLAMCGTPGFLHYTQNTYFSDIVVVAFVHILLLTLVRDRPLTSRSRGRNLFLGIMFFLCSGLDWYGLLACTTFLMVLLIRDAIAMKSKKHRVSNNVRIALNRFVPVFCGILLAILLYFFQIIVFGANFNDLYEIALFRIGLVSEHRLINYLLGFFVHIPGGFLPQLFFQTRINLSFIISVVALLGVFWHRPQSRVRVHLLLYVLFLPSLHLLLLSQHSAIHEFSGLKFSHVIVFLLFLAPMGFISRFGKNLRFFNILLFLACMIIASGTFNAAHKKLDSYSHASFDTAYMLGIRSLRLTPDFNQEIYVSAEPVVSTMLDRSDVTQNGNLITHLLPPNKLALTRKFIYKPDQLTRFRNLWHEKARTTFPVVLLAYENTVKTSQTTVTCQTRWQLTDTELPRGKLMICKTGMTADQFINIL